MRYKDIKIAESKQNKIVEFVQNPDLAKPEQMDMNQILDFIDTQSDNADPKLLQIVTKGLDKLKGYFKNKVEKVNPDALKDQPTNETLADAIDTQINDVNFMREQVKQAGGDPDDEKALEFARNLAKMLLPKGAQIGHESLNKIKAEIEQLYAPLAKKIVDGGSVFAPVVSEDDDDDAYAAEMQVKRAELSKTGQAVANSIADMANAVIEKAGREEAIKDAEVELKRIREFLKRCVTDPFIDFDQLIKQTHGTIEQEFAKKGKEYLDVYNIFENILGRTIDKSGAGAWGPGELGLLMLSNPVKKGTKGDIMTVANLQVEVKASKKATAGARLNVEQATKGNLTKDYNEVLRKYFGDSIYVGDKEMQVNHQTPKGQLNFTIKGFDILNSWVDEKIKDGEWSKAQSIQFLVDSVNIPMKNYVGTKGYDSSIKQAMSKVVDSTGKFAFKSFQIEFTKLMFALYKAEMLDCILVINPIIGTFLVMNDPADVDDAVKRGLVISGGIDFKDKQSTKSPQVGVGAVQSI